MGYHMRLLLAFSILGCALLAVCITLGIVSIVCSEWIRYSVNLSLNDSMKLQYGVTAESRTHGPFFLCINNDSSVVLTLVKDQVRYDRCLSSEISGNSSYGNAEWYVINNRRVHIAMHITAISIAFITIIYFVAAVLISWTCNDFRHPRLIRLHMNVAGALCALGVLIYFIAFIVFHIMLNIENEYRGNFIPYLYNSWNSNIQNNTVYNYDVMYALAWGSLGSELLAAASFLFSALCCYYSGPSVPDVYVNSKRSLPSSNVPSVQPMGSNAPSVVANGIQANNNGFYNSRTSFGTTASRANPLQLPTPGFGGSTLPRSGVSAVPGDTTLIPIYYQHDNRQPVQLSRAVTPDAYVAVRK